MAGINKLFWMFTFLLGVAIFGWLEWKDGSGSGVAWFMLTSLWSAFCAIAYTILHWFLVDNKESS